MNQTLWIGAALFLTSGAFLVAGAELPAKVERLPRIRIASDGRSFENETAELFVSIEVNPFRPGTWAPQVWNKFDAAATRQTSFRTSMPGRLDI